jgi:drug/metabolite transporter (DMT)-like permease
VIGSERRAYGAFLVICVVWSTTYLAIRVGLETVPPFAMGALRWTTAGAVLVTVLRARGEALPPARAWAELALYGTLLIAVANGGVMIAEQTVPSGLAAVLAAISPFWMVGIDASMPAGERLTPARVAGLALGFSGVALVAWPELAVGGRGFGLGLLATQVACAGWATGSLLSRRRGHQSAPAENVLMAAAVEMLFGGAIFAAAALATGQWRALHFTPRTLGAVAYLAVAGSIAGFSAYAYALKHLPVSTVSLYAYVNPVLAVVLGTLVLDEPFTPRIAAAAAVVLTGMAIVRRSTSRVKRI